MSPKSIAMSVLAMVIAQAIYDKFVKGKLI